MGGAGTSNNNVAVVNACGKTYNSGTTTPSLPIGGTSVTNCNYAQNVRAGDMIVIYMAFGTDAVGFSSPGDTLSNSGWSCTYNSANHEGYCWNPALTTGGADTFSVTVSNSSGPATWEGEFSGINATPLDTGGPNWNTTSSSSTASPPAITTTNANDMILICSGSITTAVFYTAQSPFVIPLGNSYTYNGGNGQSAACAVYSVTSTGTYSTTFSLSASVTTRGASFAIKSS